LEDRLFSDRRVDVLARKMGWNRFEALGFLATFWHQTQERLLFKGTASQIEDWAFLEDPNDSARIVEALLLSEFIFRKSENLYEVVGNQLQIDSRVAKSTSSRKGGKATKSKWAKIKKNVDGLAASQELGRPASREASQERAQTRLNTRQYKPEQGSAMQSKAPEPSAPEDARVHVHVDPQLPTPSAPAPVYEAPPLALPEPDKPPKPRPEKKHPKDRDETPKGSLVWQAYSAAYERRYGHLPVRNAKSNALCAQLVQRLGAEAAMGVVAFYLSHGKSYYLAKCHQLDPCVADAEALHTQMLAGHRVTTAEAVGADKQAANAQAFANVLAKMESGAL
jgi:hypothetical protein